VSDAEKWTVAAWLARADRAIVTAQSIVSDDPSAACNRAYYAMFYAARAALIQVGQIERARAKTHTGIRAAFGELLVKAGHVASEHNRAFAQVEQDRLLADYLGEGLSQAEAAKAIAQAQAFVTAVTALVQKSR
jgi:uncharacterized protein (UPF0332 family)